MSARVEIDHVLVGVPDLDDAAATLQARFGLTSLPGGRHPGWGTANRVVPLGSAYLELVTVVDRAEAAGSAFGRWVLAMLGDGPVCGWAVRTEDLDAVAARLALDVVPGSRQTGTGRWLRWRTAGVGQASTEPALPFFIEWEPGTVLPGGAEVHHAAAADGAVSLVGVEVGGDPGRLRGWLGGEPAGVQSTSGPAVLTHVVLAAGTQRLRLEPGSLRA